MSDSPKTLSRTKFNFDGQTGVFHGKVRDVYTIDNKNIAMIATDRISAFDVILPATIPFKGQVLNQLSARLLDQIKDIMSNWLISTPDENVSIGLKAEPIKIELVIRGCLVGHAWRVYSEGKRQLCGVKLPNGLKQYDEFAEPIITPTTKNDSGHDMDITEQEIISQGLASEDNWTKIKVLMRKLFARGQEIANTKGLYLADSKYEFGMHSGKLMLIDEIHTPDSSRYYYLESFKDYTSGKKPDLPTHLSKEFVREWLIDHGFSGQKSQKIPELTDDFVNDISKNT